MIVAARAHGDFGSAEQAGGWRSHRPQGSETTRNHASGILFGEAMGLKRAKVLLRLLSAAAIVSVCPAGVASAQVSPTDAGATHAYLEARLALRHTEAAHLSAETNAVDALAQTVKTECPDVLQHAGSYIDSDDELHPVGTEIWLELAQDIPAAGERVEHATRERFYKAVQRLRWSSPGLTKRLHDLALEGVEQSGLPTPPLCADLKFWVGSDYTATSAATKHYLQRFDEISGIGVESRPEIARRLSSYEDKADRLLAKKVLPKEPSSSSPAEAPRVEAENKVYEVLGTKLRP